ncbi:MAG TPA: hypothetical protein VF475_14660 [Sphingobium sp.]
MKALTIYQPWASLVMASAKPYEFRGWNPIERGGAYAALIGQRIVIHASAHITPRYQVVDLHNKLQAGGELAAYTCLHAGKALPLLNRALGKSLHSPLPISAGLGTAVLGNPRNGYDIAEEFGVPHVNDSERDEHANWGWPMLDIEVWDEPIPMRGFQGFWKWPEPGSVGL